MDEFKQDAVAQVVERGYAISEVVEWSCPAYVPVSELTNVTFHSNAKGLLPPSDEWRQRGL